MKRRTRSWTFGASAPPLVSHETSKGCPGAFESILKHLHRSSAWWYTYPSEKYESQLGWLFPTYGKIKHVPNDQPVIYVILFECIDRYMSRLSRIDGIDSAGTHFQPASIGPAPLLLLFCCTGISICGLEASANSCSSLTNQSQLNFKRNHNHTWDNCPVAWVRPHWQVWQIKSNGKKSSVYIYIYIIHKASDLWAQLFHFGLYIINSDCNIEDKGSFHPPQGRNVP